MKNGTAFTYVNEWRDMNKSSSRTLEILEYFAGLNGGSAGVSEVSRIMDLPKSSTFALLNTMEEQGYLEYATPEKKNFRLGMRSYHMGMTIVRQMDIGNTTKQILEKLHRDTEQTVFYAKLQDDKVIFIDKLEKNGAVRLSLDIGSQGKMHLTAAGKAMAASMTDDEVVERLGSGCYEVHTVSSINTWHKLKQELEQIRQNGYATEICEDNPYTYAMAASVLNQEGHTEAAVEVAMLAVDWENTDLGMLAAQVMQAAQKISEINGFSKINTKGDGYEN